MAENADSNARTSDGEVACTGGLVEHRASRAPAFLTALWVDATARVDHGSMPRNVSHRVQRGQLGADADPNPNRLSDALLFHGTRTDGNVANILAEGLKLRFANASGMLGGGIYGAPDLRRRSMHRRARMAASCFYAASTKDAVLWRME